MSTAMLTIPVSQWNKLNKKVDMICTLLAAQPDTTKKASTKGWVRIGALLKANPTLTREQIRGRRTAENSLLTDTGHYIYNPKEFI